MSTIFGINFESLLGKKDDELVLDKNTLETINQIPVHTMKNDLDGNFSEAFNSPAILKPNIEPPKKPTLQNANQIKPTIRETANPFMEKIAPLPNPNQTEKEPAKIVMVVDSIPMCFICVSTC